MFAKRIFIAAIAGVLFAAAGVAAAGNFSSDRQIDFFAEGTHQFYVWCSTASDYVATADGANAEDAQQKLYEAAKETGNSACWPVWQGRISSS